MISALLLQPVLSEGQGSAVEAVISAVLERINSTDGSVCHEETIGGMIVDVLVPRLSPRCVLILVRFRLCDLSELASQQDRKCDSAFLLVHHGR